MLLIHTFMGLAMAAGTVIVGLVVLRPSPQCLISLQYLCQATLYGIGNDNNITISVFDFQLQLFFLIISAFLLLLFRSVTAGAGHGQRLPRLRPLRLALRILPGRLPVRRSPIHAGQGPCQAIRPRMEPRPGRPLLANSLRRPHSR